MQQWRIVEHNNDDHLAPQDIDAQDIVHSGAAQVCLSLVRTTQPLEEDGRMRETLLSLKSELQQYSRVFSHEIFHPVFVQNIKCCQAFFFLDRPPRLPVLANKLSLSLSQFSDITRAIIYFCDINFSLPTCYKGASL